MSRKPPLVRFYEPRCKCCRFAKEHPEIAAYVEARILQGRSKYSEIIQLLEREYGFRVDQKQLRHHIDNHLPDRAIIVKTALEQGLEGVADITDLTKENLTVLQVLKQLGIYELQNGNIKITDPGQLLAVVAQQHKMIEGDKVVIEYGDRPTLMPPELVAEFMEIIYEFVPPNRRRELRARLEERVLDRAKDHYRLAIEAKTKEWEASNDG